MLFFNHPDGIEWGSLRETHNIASDYGWFHVYAFTMTLGMIFAIGFAAIKLYIRKISVIELLFGAVFVVPISLFGASFVGKVNKTDSNGHYYSFFGKFQFWQGGMAIHGGVLAGLVAGLIIFHLIGRFRTKVSMWTYADAIVPNILIGQVVGRWGNFFNHEIPGLPVYNVSTGSGHNPLAWLPKWIYENTQASFLGTNGIKVNGINMVYGDVYQLEPVFLYESFGLFLVWLVVTFIIPGFGRWISKKPWNLFPESYKLDMKYSFKVFFTFGRARKEDKMTYYDIWNDGFYHTYDAEALEKYELYYKEHFIENRKWSLGKHWKNGVALERANNPNRYLVVKSGVETGFYFFAWNLVRFIIEQRRPVSDALFNDERVASNVTIIICFVFGLIIMGCAQWVFPYLFRKTDYRYEKEYFVLDAELLASARAKKLEIKMNKKQLRATKK